MADFDDNEFVSEDIIWDGENRHRWISIDQYLQIPVFQDNSNVPANTNLWRNDGTGPNSDGVYFRDEGGNIVQLSTGGGGYTDEQAQDAVGTILSADFTYDDAGNAINMSPHTGTSDAHHSRYTDSEATTAVGGSTPWATADIAAQAITAAKVDGSGGTVDQVLQTDGTAGGVTWADVSGGSGSLDHPEWNVVDVVDEHGADNTGATETSTEIQDGMVDNTLLVFRPGTYLVDCSATSTMTLTGFNRFGMIGYGDATIKVAGTNNTTPIFQLGSSASPGSELYIENMRLDYSTDQAGGPSLTTYISDVMDVNGWYLQGGVYDGPCVIPHLVNEDAVGQIKNLLIPDGAQTGYDPGTSGGPEGIWMGAENVGNLRIINPVIANLPNNGLYLSESDGHTEVIGGYFKNNGVASIRLGDGDLVRGAEVVVDGTTHSSQRAIWFRRGQPSAYNCNITVTSTDGYRPVETDPDCVGGTLEDIHLNIDNASTHPVQINAPTGTNKGFLLNNIRVEGDATGPGFEDYAIVSYADKTTVQDCYTNMTDASMGSMFINGADCTIDRHDAASAINDSGTRTIHNGWGENAGDPTSTGDWNGNGIEGVMVRDTTNNVSYVFKAGAWLTI